MNNHHIISLCFILFFTFPSNPFSAAQNVLDTQGNTLQPGAEYYAKYISSPLGGPTLGSFGCPKSVIHNSQINGLPISIRPKIGNDIVESSNVYITFTAGNPQCPEYNSTIWRINRGVGGTTIITVGGDYAGGDYDSFSEFNIVKSGSAYMFTYGSRFIINLGSSLGLNTRDRQPYLVVFLKRSSANVIQLPK